MSQIDKWYDILNVLTTQEQIGENDLKEIVGLSTPTLRKSIDTLNQYLKEIAEIYKEDNVYYLRVDDYSLFSDILAGELKKEIDYNSSSKRIAFIFKELMTSDTHILIDDLAEELGVSRGTATRDLKDIKKIAATFHVEIIGTPNKGLKMEGPEFELRLIYLYHVYDYFPSYQFIEEMSAYIQKYAHIKNIPDTSIKTWKKVLEITLTRILSKHNLTQPIPHYTNYQHDDEEFDELIYMIESLYHISLSQYDIDFISFPLNISNTGAVEQVYMNESFVRTVFDKMMDKVFDSTSIEFDRDRLYDEMHFHLLYMLNRLIFRMENYDYFYGEIENKYPFAYEIGKVAIKEVEAQIGRTASEAEVSYLAVYFELLMKKNEEPKKEIAIVCNTGKGTAALMKQQINSVLGNNIRIQSYTEEEYKQRDLNDYFAIFTTIPLENMNATMPIIRITNLFNDEWLHSEWQRVKKTKKFNFEHVEFVFSKVGKDASYREKITQMIDKLSDKEIVDEAFAKRIFNREEQQTTVFSNGIAFPHAINYGSNKIIFHLSILDSQTVVDNEEIELIFLVGIPHDMTDYVESELLGLYDYMLKIVSDKEKLTEMYQLSTSEEFSNWLWREVF